MTGKAEKIHAKQEFIINNKINFFSYEKQIIFRISFN